MGLLGRIVGGALSGVGAGMAQAAEARRQQSLEILRQQFQTQQADTAYERQRERDDTTYKRQAERDATLQGYKVENDTRDYQQDVGKIAVTARAQQSRDQQQHGYTMAEIGAKQLNEQDNIRLKSRLDRSNTAAEVRLRDSLEAGDVRSVVRGKDGQYYGVTDRGLVATGVKADPTAGAASSNGGGALTESEQTVAFNDARREWRTGGKVGPEPKASDFIGMTRAEYAARRNGRGGDTTPDAEGESSDRPASPPARRGGLLSRAAPAAPEYSAEGNAALMTRLGGNPFPTAAGVIEKGGTYTMADVRRVAQARGVSEQQVMDTFRAQGLKLTGAK